MDLTTYSREKVEALYREALKHPESQIKPELRHFFAEGVYGREMFMPAGCCVIGKVHLFDHLCTVLGEVSIFSQGGLMHYDGYHTFPTNAGTQRTLFAHGPTWVTTYHANPDNETDIEKLEARNASDDFSLIDCLPESMKLIRSVQ